MRETQDSQIVLELPSIQERRGEGIHISWAMQTLKLRSFLIVRTSGVSMNQQQCKTLSPSCFWIKRSSHLLTLFTDLQTPPQK